MFWPLDEKSVVGVGVAKCLEFLVGSVVDEKCTFAVVGGELGSGGRSVFGRHVVEYREVYESSIFLALGFCFCNLIFSFSHVE